MTAQAVLVAACLVLGAAVTGWPNSPARRLFADRGSAARGTAGWNVAGWGVAGWNVAAAGPAALTARASVASARHPRGAIAAIGVTAALAGWLAAGPVTAMVAGAYAALGARAALRRVHERRRAAAHARTLDDLCALAADLRAGLPPARTVLTGASPVVPVLAPAAAAVTVPSFSADVGVRGQATDGSPGPTPERLPAPAEASGPAEARMGELVAAVWRLAERTGAPAAELVERIEADVRAADRSRASAAAQAAGAKATALLLAGLPVGGLALGYGIGVDPLAVLLHTPLGAGCAAGTVALQAAGLAWADRLATGPAR